MARAEESTPGVDLCYPGLMTRTLLSTLAFFALLAAPSVALAGGCPTCTSDADCMDPGGGAAFCVEWSRDFGCGSLRMACCPGQGCDTFSGRPSCEGADRDGDGVDDCVVVGAGTDAGPGGTDAGPPASDGGPSGTDAGPTGSDAGGGAMDGGGPVGVDAGTGGTEGGCACRASRSTPGAGLAPLALLALGLLRRRR